MIALKDIDVGRARARIEQHDHGARLDSVIDLVRVLQREGVDVDDDRRAARLRDHARVVGDLLFLRRHEEDVHRALAAGGVPFVENLVVEVDVLDIERDVLLRLPVDRLGELRLRHHRQRDLLDDDGVARERGGDILGLDAAAVEQAADGVGDGGGVDDRAVDDAVRGHRLAAEIRDPVALAGLFQLDRLDGARTDVQTDQRFRSAKHRGVLSCELLATDCPERRITLAKPRLGVNSTHPVRQISLCIGTSPGASRVPRRAGDQIRQNCAKVGSDGRF